MADDEHVVELGPAMSELALWKSGTGVDTTGCVCGHDGLGPDWHGDECPVTARLWRRKAWELAGRLDAPLTIVDDGANGIARLRRRR